MPAQVYSGTGDPNAVVFGNPGDIYQDETGAFWLKETGVATNTGWVQLSGTSSVSASNVLTFRPGSGLTGPVVFDDFNALYAQFDALRAAAQNSGKFQIVFDDQDVGGPGNTVVLNSGPGPVTYDFQYATLVGVHEDANVLLDITSGGGEGDSLSIINALWFEGLTIRALGNGTAFTAQANQTFTLTRTTFLGGGGQFVMDFLAVAGCILHLNDESTIDRNGVFPAGQAPIRINNSAVTVHMNGANCRVTANSFTTGGGAQVTPIVNSSSARFDFDQADAGGVVNAQMSTAAGYWTYGAPFTVTDPNGVLSATKSTLIVDEATGLIWRNTDGATAWEAFADATATRTFGALLADGTSIPLPASSNTTVLSAAIPAGQIPAARAALVTATAGVMWDLPFTAQTQASLVVIVEFDDGINPPTQVATSNITVNPEQPTTPGTSIGPAFYILVAQGLLSGAVVNGAAGTLRMRVLTNGETTTYQLTNGGGGSAATMVWAVTPLANVQVI